MVYNGYTIETNAETSYEPDELTDWQSFVKSWKAFWNSPFGKYLSIKLFVAATALAVICPAFAPMYASAVIGVGISLGVGAVIAGYRSLSQGNGFWEGFANHLNENWAQELAISMALAMVTFGVSQAAQAIKTAGANKKLANSAIPEDISRPETVRVGRWMSEKEFSKIQSGNLVDTYGGGGAVHVAYPANPNAFGKQALPGSLYIEFDVPLNSIKNAGSGWARIVGPNSIESRLLISKGLQPLQYPKIENIIKVGYKDGNIIKFF